jgi:hypothetical protein
MTKFSSLAIALIFRARNVEKVTPTKIAAETLNQSASTLGWMDTVNVDVSKQRIAVSRLGLAIRLTLECASAERQVARWEPVGRA